MRRQPLLVFAHRLALSLGVWDVDAMLDAMPAPVLFRWMAYAQIEPFGEERSDLRAGIIASTVANVNRGRRAPYKVSDFMPKFSSRQQTPAEMGAILFAAAAAARAGKPA